MPDASFGVILPAALDREDARAFCLEAEQLGFTGLWVNDNGRGPDPFALLSLAAALTERVTLGTAVFLLPLRHPVQVARSAATVDRLSAGRLVFGIGVGGERPADFAAAGVEPNARGARADEALTVIDAVWSGDPASHAGRFYQFSDVQLGVRPVQPRLPVWVGGRMGGQGRHRDAALRRAARRGEGWFPYQMTPEQFSASVERLSGYCAEADREADTLARALVQFVNVGPDPVEARRVAIERQSASYGMDFTPFVDRYVITGTPAMCAARIREYLRAGVQHLVFNWACPPTDARRSVRLIAEEVLPALAAEAV